MKVALDPSACHATQAGGTKRCLIVELWGVGDLVMMTAALRGLLAEGWEVTVLGKPHARALLESTYPQVSWIAFDAPWTVFLGKYRLWCWPWRRLFGLFFDLRVRRFDAAVSVRKDPRDHLLMWLTGAKRRIGFATRLGRFFLNEAVPVSRPEAHKVEDWWEVQDRMLGAGKPHLLPQLVPDAGLVEKFRARFRENFGRKPVLALHCGARIAVRRWPEAYFRELVLKLRGEFDFGLVLFPDPDGYGSGLADLADVTLSGLSLPELVAALGCASALVGNDSAPAHIADAMGVPAVALFGPTKPEWFRPYGKEHLVVIRDICAYRPCFDYCRFPEPYCLTRLKPEVVWPEVWDYFRRSGVLSG